MKSDYINDRELEHLHIPDCIDLLYQCLRYLVKIKPSSVKEDTKYAVDLVIDIPGVGDVAVRVRRPKYRDRYRDLTIRAYRTSGTKTELEKIRDGFAKFYLYCWLNYKGKIEDWILIDLDALRKSGLLDNPRITANNDGKTGFADFHDFELRRANCLIAEQDHTPPEETLENGFWKYQHDKLEEVHMTIFRRACQWRFMLDSILKSYDHPSW